MFHKSVFSPQGIRPRRIWLRYAWVECERPRIEVSVTDSRLKFPTEYIFSIVILRWRWERKHLSGKEAIR
jgi:hypothetical protein